MSFLHVHFSEIDTQISAFARAIALPIRVFILRMIAENGNSLTKQAFYTSAFNTKTINKHIQELRGLGIIKTKTVKAEVTYCIDEKLFGQMSANFSAFFEQNSLQGEEQISTNSTHAAAGPPESLHFSSFGAYIKEHRLELNLSQAALASKINIDRALLSRIETGKKDLSADKLPTLAKALYLNVDELRDVSRKLSAITT
ncbi:helix-turn-helix domain-containing protein [Mucilaginibacter gilvus]|uniref:Helix-turn-helix domain-containing protein n=1 Tax=Mucilaginibacter gilvus TaxID=2305909 RepID=A0A3S3VTX7_9SPHI|nr:helix-turn-helix domain-containing protein [Mucilaginibacter gilvus]RWY55822.1 helix-turn-helix domain-containing protein [Mucilaginibacter gilvus]